VKIYYKQRSSPYTDLFSELDIKDLYFKHIYTDRDTSKISNKEHHHNSFEIHIIKKGFQEYEIDNEIYPIHSGEFLFLPPFTKHKVTNFSPETEKFSITFASQDLLYLNKTVINQTPMRFFENAEFIINEYGNTKNTSTTLIENSVLECTLLFLRLAGLRENPSVRSSDSDDPRLDYAKKYISDNIENWFTVSDLAAYCHISISQLTRIFLNGENMTPAQYITKSRTEHIHKLLENDDLSLKEISEQMNFQNEYYFNAFVKKHLGMPPGTYRKTIK